MNKLVSRNSVQRFRSGKIIKAYNGSSTTKFSNNLNIIELTGPSGERGMYRYNPFNNTWYNTDTKVVLPKGYTTPDGYVIDGDYAIVSNQKNAQEVIRTPTKTPVLPTINNIMSRAKSLSELKPKVSQKENIEKKTDNVENNKKSWHKTPTVDNLGQVTYPSEQKGNSKNNSKNNNSQINQNKQQIAKTQQFLINLGYDLGKTGADGIWGRKTQAAWEKYQRDKLMSSQLDQLMNSQKFVPDETAYETPSREAYDYLTYRGQTPTLKTGGQLVSKNPIRRFQQGGNIFHNKYGTYVDLGNGTVAQAYSIRGKTNTNEIIDSDGKKYYYNPQFAAPDVRSPFEKIFDTARVIQALKSQDILSNSLRRYSTDTDENAQKVARQVQEDWNIRSGKKKAPTTASKTSTSRTSSKIIDWDTKFNEAISKLTPEQLEKLDSNGINYQTAQSLQEGLNKKFNSGLKVDNKWGTKSQTALDKVLANLAYGNNSGVQWSSADYRPAMTHIITSEGEAIPIGQNDVVVTTNPKNPINTNPLFNRADIRAILRHYGYNPYEFTASQRKALRKFLQGDNSQDISWIDKDSQLYKEWITPFVTFKKNGGKVLQSRNVVERFRNKINK